MRAHLRNLPDFTTAVQSGNETTQTLNAKLCLNFGWEWSSHGWTSWTGSGAYDVMYGTDIYKHNFNIFPYVMRQCTKPTWGELELVWNVYLTNFIFRWRQKRTEHKKKDARVEIRVKVDGRRKCNQGDNDCEKVTHTISSTITSAHYLSAWRQLTLQQ